ncbi:alpha/beta hydrolase [Actinokineospora auranticolor]|uniref:Alpha/beta hydrolase family protein n=1 Tax=Actinokineospora auranticolor TaxID=155976 RepID=A0A2S6GE92_9PSEU|nr:alpha/beta hydrolase [Actinokineospora auranticolor]PPK63396.1 alpha/beta hydrolase family protein [Actinokineospora auranticolor]
MRISRGFPLVTPLLAAVTLSSCTVVVDGAPSAGQLEQRGPKGPVPAGLERFYGQPLNWTDCPPLAYDEDSRAAYAVTGILCTRLTVPLDYAKPDGRAITIGVLRRAATGPDRVGALVMNPGGPGVSGMNTAATLGFVVKDRELGKRFDFIGFDPRGVGLSEPRVRCRNAAETDAERSAPERKEVAQVEASNKDFVARCTERSGGTEVLANIGTRDVVRDMDVLRSALGEEKLTYVGYSYGTRIGTAYAEAFPGNVRAMVLDGAVDPLADPVDASIRQARGFDDAFKTFLGWCAAREKCQVKTEPELAKLLRPLRDAPLAVGDRKLSYSDAGIAMASALYSQLSWTRLERAINELAKGDGGTLLEMADEYLGRSEQGEYRDTMAALTAVRCVDDPRTTDRAKVEENARKVAEASKDMFMADPSEPTIPTLDTCAFWPVPNTSEPHQPKVDGLPEVVVVSTTGDPATPYESGVTLAKALKARLITYVGDQHTVFLGGGNSCVDDAGSTYLIDLRAPLADIECRAG